MSPRPLNPAQYAEIFKQHQDNPWLWLLEITVSNADGTTDALRLVRNPVPIEWRTFDDGETAIEWLPFPFEPSGIDENSEGNLRSMSISVSNVTRDAQALLEHHNGLEGSPVTLYLIDGSRLDDERPLLEFEAEVVGAGANRETATIQLGTSSLQRIHFPAQRIERGSCRHWQAGEYGGTNCGYDTTRDGSLQVCDGTYDGPLGCVMHGDEEVAALGGEQYRLHPLRGGFARGVARKTGLGST